jgi:diaminopimelate decarboxylase
MDKLQLLEKYGSPLYVFNDAEFIENYRHLCSAMRSYYPNYLPAYSYKTNYTPHVCKLVKGLGGYAEVVSDMELYVALKIGYKHEHIVYNGPCKGPQMEEHVLNGGISNVDNKAEALRVVTLAKAHPETIIRVGIRINTDIGASFISRFGLEVDSDEMDNVVAILKAEPNIKVVGLHMHVSRARYIEAWQKRIDNILYAADKYIDGLPEYIDLGSGMFADMEDYLKNQFTIKVPTYEVYAEVVAGTMAKHYENAQKKPLLLTEPGTTVVSRYLSILTTVSGVKTIKDKHIALVDADYHNTGETSRMLKVPFTHYHCGDGEESGEQPDIMGFTCLEQDYIFKEFPEKVKVGDVIEFRNIGGYSVVYKPPFIQPCCAMVAVGEDGNVKLIKEKESFEDIFKTYIF